MKVNGQLKNAQLEIVSTNPEAGTKGKIVYNSDCENPIVDTGSEQTRIQVEQDNPVGQIMMWPLDNPPNGRWIECNGQSLAKGNFQDLYDVLGGAYGETTANFNVPDYRGFFLRGEDPANVRDTDPRTARADGGTGAGSTQDDAIIRHTHTFTYQDSRYGVVGLSTPTTLGPVTGGTLAYGSTDQTRSGVTQTSGTSTIETRPVNISVKFFIKAK